MPEHSHLKSFHFELSVYAPASFQQSEIRRHILSHPPKFCTGYARQDARFGDSNAWLWNPEVTIDQNYQDSMGQDGWLPLQHPKTSEVLPYTPVPLRIYLGEQLLPLVQDEHLSDQLNNIKTYIQQELGVESPPLELLDNLSGPTDQIVLEMPNGQQTQATVHLDRLFVTGPAISLQEFDLPLERNNFLPYPGKWVLPEEARSLTDHPYPIIGAWVFLHHMIGAFVHRHLASLLTLDRLAEQLAQLEPLAPILVDSMLQDPHKLTYLKNMVQAVVRHKIPLSPWLPLLEACDTMLFHASPPDDLFHLYLAEPQRFWVGTLEDDQLPVWCYDPQKFLASPLLTPQPEAYLIATLSQALATQPRAKVVIIPDSWKQIAQTLHPQLQHDFLLTPEYLTRKYPIGLLHLGSIGELPSEPNNDESQEMINTTPTKPSKKKTSWF